MTSATGATITPLSTRHLTIAQIRATINKPSGREEQNVRA